MMMEFLVGDDKKVVEWKKGRKELDSGMLLSLSHMSQASERAGPQLLTMKTTKTTTTTKTTGREREEEEREREKQRTTHTRLPMHDETERERALRYKTGCGQEKEEDKEGVSRSSQAGLDYLGWE